MEGNIEITIKTVPGGARAAQRFEGRDAEFIKELMTRQGEVQDK